MRLIAFGCSQTYGHGLEDCYISPNYPNGEPSKLAWPSLVARQMNIPCINMSSPGASNKRIWNSIMNFQFQKDDVVFVMWSYPERSCIIDSKKPNAIRNIGRWMDDADYYYNNFYSEYDSMLMSQLHVNHANSYLKEKYLTVYNLACWSEVRKIFKLNNQTTPDLKIYISDLRNKFGYALDNLHPGAQCHVEVARLICQKLNVPFDLARSEPASLIERFKRWYNTDRTI